MLAEHAHRDGADLVMEVVSDDGRNHDGEAKRREYAQSGIPEYRIAGPLMKRITAVALAADSYAVHGEFSPRRDRRHPPGFSIPVADALAPAH